MMSQQSEMDARPCTVKDVAQLAGVSVATVSRVVNGATNVSLPTKDKVLTAISRLQYCPNTSAAELGRAGSGIPKIRRTHVPPLTQCIRKDAFDPMIRGTDYVP
jgi:DNA-binding LacI/PurR family transcriptional regulator